MNEDGGGKGRGLLLKGSKKGSPPGRYPCVCPSVCPSVGRSVRLALSCLPVNVEHIKNVFSPPLPSLHMILSPDPIEENRRHVPAGATTFTPCFALAGVCLPSSIPVGGWCDLLSSIRSSLPWSYFSARQNSQPRPLFSWSLYCLSGPAQACSHSSSSFHPSVHPSETTINHHSQFAITPKCSLPHTHPLIQQTYHTHSLSIHVHIVLLSHFASSPICRLRLNHRHINPSNKGQNKQTQAARARAQHFIFQIIISFSPLSPYVHPTPTRALAMANVCPVSACQLPSCLAGECLCHDFIVIISARNFG